MPLEVIIRKWDSGLMTMNPIFKLDYFLFLIFFIINYITVNYNNPVVLASAKIIKIQLITTSFCVHIIPNSCSCISKDNKNSANHNRIQRIQRIQIVVLASAKIIKIQLITTAHSNLG